MPLMENPFNNPEFRREMTALLDEKLAPLAHTVAQHEAAVAQHEAQLQQAKGARWTFAVMWTGLVGLTTMLVEWLAHRHA